ncbi:hypothetical protein AiwAL_13085 [Acidiphilium sp. AL]|uniref:hypothetical protein n=1 Tax=Acidiphilium sp. AL TaxID=2871704 RepID=UPI0021CB734A|nr:hypothetical protein [Acidiphilium sp. AL]MCU4161028.1 hypothetical protein [Acidiphilium sp. AL]
MTGSACFVGRGRGWAGGAGFATTAGLAGLCVDFVAAGLGAIFTVACLALTSAFGLGAAFFGAAGLTTGFGLTAGFGFAPAVLALDFAALAGAGAVLAGAAGLRGCGFAAATIA